MSLPTMVTLRLMPRPTAKAAYSLRGTVLPQRLLPPASVVAEAESSVIVAHPRAPLRTPTEGTGTAAVSWAWVATMAIQPFHLPARK